VSASGAGIPATSYQLGARTLARFVELRDDAVSFAMAAGARARPEDYVRFGAGGRAACAEDIRYHLEFLQPTLETNDISPFLGYLAWLVQVLRNRSVPHQSVARSLDDLAAFFLDRLGEQGVPIATALSAGTSAIADGVAASGFDQPCPARWDEAEAYSAAVLQAKQSEATALLERAFARSNSLPLVEVHVIQPAMYDVGRLWQQNGVSVAQEHFATALSQSWMARRMAQVNSVPGNGLRALFGCLAENHHVMGSRMVADAFELGGWTTFNMIANASPEAVARQTRELRPDLVGFSASLPQHVRLVRQAIAALRKALGEECPRIVVGGLVINQFPLLAEWVGAEVLGADAVSAAAAAEPPRR
jgi:methanogenic corrinoid protein MtbC1